MKYLLLCVELVAFLFAGTIRNDPTPLEEKESIIFISELENVSVIVEETEPETIAETQAKPQPQKQSTYYKTYKIHGVIPPLEWQKALYDELNAKGIAWYMPYAVCQIWQESNWNQWSDNGRDKGICQQKAIYWANRAAYYGVSGADIFNVYAQFHVYAGMMSGFLYSNNGNIGMALSCYYLGTGEYAPEYVNHVTSHLNYLEEIYGG